MERVVMSHSHTREKHWIGGGFRRVHVRWVLLVSVLALAVDRGVQAQTTYPAEVNRWCLSQGLAATAPTCATCHAGAPESAVNADTPAAKAWRNADLAALCRQPAAWTAPASSTMSISPPPASLSTSSGPAASPAAPARDLPTPAVVKPPTSAPSPIRAIGGTQNVRRRPQSDDHSTVQGMPDND
jgi:hypothetical protein